MVHSRVVLPHSLLLLWNLARPVVSNVSSLMDARSDEIGPTSYTRVLLIR